MKVRSPGCVRRGVGEKIRSAVERTAVGVDPQVADIEVVARKLEIVGIAAEEGDRLLRREHQPHVLVTAVLVEIVDAAVIELDDVAADVRLRCRSIRRAMIARSAFKRVGEGLPVLAGNGPVDAIGHVGDIDELIDLDVGTLDLVFCFARVEAGGDEILRRRRELLDAGAGAMMIGLHQAVWRNEASRAAAREANRR